MVEIVSVVVWLDRLGCCAERIRAGRRYRQVDAVLVLRCVRLEPGKRRQADAVGKDAGECYRAGVTHHGSN